MRAAQEATVSELIGAKASPPVASLAPPKDQNPRCCSWQLLHESTDNLGSSATDFTAAVCSHLQDAILLPAGQWRGDLL